MFRADIESSGYQSLSALFSYSNIYLWKLTRDYWGIQPEDTMFLHTWSLSLEEQFYILYPILAVFVLKKYKNYFKHLCITLCIIGFLCFTYFSRDKQQASFYLLPFRFWELILGCTVAIFYTTKSSRIKILSNYRCFIIGWIGLCFVVGSFYLIDSKDGVGASLIIPTVGTALFLSISDTSKYSSARFLSNKFFTFLGKISYSLYLWHWPLLYFFKHFNLNLNLLYIVTLLLISSINYFLIEKPARIYSGSLPYIFILFGSCVIFSVFIIFNGGKYDTSSFNPTIWSGFYYDSTPQNEKFDYGDKLKERMSGIIMSNDLNKSSDVNGILSNDTKYINQDYEILVIGDSHSLMWSPIIDIISKELKIKAKFKGTDGRFKFLEDFSKHASTNEKDTIDVIFYRKLINNKSLVIIGTRWDNHPNGNSQIKNLVKYIHECGGRTILVEQPPVLYFGDKNTAQFLSYLGHHPPKNNKIYLNHNPTNNWINGNKFAERLSKSYSSCSYF